MSEVCNCCGKKILLLDLDYSSIEIDKEIYKICSDCNNKFSAYKDGNLFWEELVSSSTNPKLKVYFKRFLPNEKSVEEVRRRKQKVHNKLIAQENDPLYDDIHQIAGDIRFIKNLIILGLVCSFILGIIGVL